METEFNLLDEKWIRVRRKNCTVDELSLIDTLLHAHEYKGLAGELPTQDVAILRLLLAILHTVFYYYAPDGEEEILDDPDDVLDRWETIWNAGRFPEEPIRNYLDKWYDRFWLFHPERPFYQTDAAKVGTQYGASKLNGAISESSNKVRLFANCSGSYKDELTYAEAARWLIHLNSFDDASVKPYKGDGKKGDKEEKLKPGVGWLGKLGLIMASGNTLFETLMYNFIILNPQSNFDVWDYEKPVWELPNLKIKERNKIVPPGALSELYTLQSRRIYLRQENEKVIGYNELSGDFFDTTNVFIEPMTIWRSQTPVKFEPQVHDSAKQMWREFSTICVLKREERKRKDDKTPHHEVGIVSWIAYLKSHTKCFDQESDIRFCMSSVKYGPSNSSYHDIFSDSLTFHADLLTELGTDWQTKITEEVAKCDELSKEVKILAKKLIIAAGSSEDDAKECTFVQKSAEQLYYEIDMPFRQWLASIDPKLSISSDVGQNLIMQWHEKAKSIAKQMGRNFVESAGTTAIVGRIGEDGKYYCAAEAYRNFQYWLNKIYPKEENHG